ncbi:hypothetical protein BURCENBC7_AP3452 [Burkholderia cenocepacia BC7]|nr:hypothetical protein BURCENBC7_AP3452 [Burkholderia cenocepacia BC7]
MSLPTDVRRSPLRRHDGAPHGFREYIEMNAARAGPAGRRARARTTASVRECRRSMK